ncbi:MAG: CinA family protein [Gammaproteobacteria bacterium]|nr:CinA family protein [Gammaproteobacteria bacterium]
MKNTQINTLAEILLAKQFKFASAESCTGGLIAKQCTDLAGSSAWFDRAFITYSNAAKVEMLGVAPQLIEKHGAVSQQVVDSMAKGAIKNSLAQTAIAVSGVAGPTGGSKEKPVGTVWIGVNVNNKVLTQCCLFEGNRAQIREQSAEFSVNWLIEILSLNECK